EPSSNAPAEAGALWPWRLGVFDRLRHLALLRDRILLLAGAALVTGFRREVRLHVRLRHERDSRVRVRWRDEPGRVLVEPELEDGQPALQVRLLVDREVEITGIDRLEDIRVQVVATRLDPLLVEAVLLHHGTDGLRRAR